MSGASRQWALSHKDYLESLHVPSPEEQRRIADVQRLKELEIDSKYHTNEEHEAATIIQKAYRGHRERRQLQGLTLDPSSRWLEIIKELRYRAATLPHYDASSPGLSSSTRSRAASETAKTHWQRLGYIAKHAASSEVHRPSQDATGYLDARPRASTEE